MANKTHQQSGSLHAVLIIITTLALLGTIGYLFWQNFINKEQSNSASSVSRNEKNDSSSTANSAPSATPEPVAHSTTSAEPTKANTTPEGWKTFTSAKYGFSFAYPPAWKVKTAGPGSRPGDNFLYVVQMLTKDRKVGKYDLYDEYVYVSPAATFAAIKADFYESPGRHHISSKQIKIDGQKALALRYGLPPDSKDKETSYYVVANGYTYSLPLVLEYDNEFTGITAKTSRLMFESFRFTKPQ